MLHCYMDLDHSQDIQVSHEFFHKQGRGAYDCCAV